MLDSGIAPEDQPVHIDIERMKRALAGPRYRIPHGMTVDQIGAFMDEVSRAYCHALEDAAQAVHSVRVNWRATGDPEPVPADALTALELATAAISELKNSR